MEERNSVFMVLKAHHNKEEYTIVTTKEGDIHLIGGKVELHETVINGMRRELKEELRMPDTLYNNIINNREFIGYNKVLIKGTTWCQHFYESKVDFNDLLSIRSGDNEAMLLPTRLLSKGDISCGGYIKALMKNNKEL